ncbi:MAG: peptidase domain-containing ABC transporter, partial [Chitinophagales bacterium]
KMTGDLLQRINDHKRIESFLTNSSLNTLFSFINLFVFGAVLAIYDWVIFGVFLGGSILHIAWVAFFLKKRRQLDYKRFNQLAANQSNLIQLVTGMQEIKLNNYEKRKRWEWEKIQAALFQVSVKGLQLEQYQQIGALVFNEVKNILITFIAAKAVIEGDMTLGMMMAVSYIIGQLNAPIAQLIQFLKLGQDAKISLERLGEIHNQKEEGSESTGITIMPEKGDLNLENLSFQYGGPQSEMVLKNVTLQIPENKITAIVGTSGSGKTTLVKLLLKFYESTKGKIRLGDIGLNNIESRLWRDRCGAVMQDGFIFSESIARNIAVSDDIIDKRKLLKAVKSANIQQFIESLPLGYNTKIGQEGMGLSGGQKQRILIARAIYKNPDYIFFDEATSALDAKNERIIMENLEEFYKGRTVVIVAHRLSTVQNADQIVVLEAGELVELGTHEELVAKRGNYYTLVKNQLELGS